MIHPITLMMAAWTSMRTTAGLSFPVSSTQYLKFFLDKIKVMLRWRRRSRRVFKIDRATTTWHNGRVWMRMKHLQEPYTRARISNDG
jgi:hypothetical protein